jgi:putative dimethyl sulfoxide reductase chaperone
MDGYRDPNQLIILAALLGFPDDDALGALRDLLPVAPWLSPPLQELEKTPLEHWQGEHTRLFLSGYPKTPCPPFESAYRQGQMGGTAASDLEALYSRAGLKATAAPADYLGTLLECLALLTERGDMGPVLEELWEAHLQRWLPRFSQDLQAHSELGLYRELGVRLEGLCGEMGND